MKRIELSEQIGSSRATVNRFMRDNGLKTGQHTQYPKDVVKKICEFHEQHGVKKTQEKFPDVKVRSIVERYQTNAYLASYDFKQIHLFLKYSEMLSDEQLYQLLGRSVSNRKIVCKATERMIGFGKNPSRVYLNGLPYRFVKNFTKDSIPYFKFSHGHCRKLCLWYDIKKHLSKNVSLEIKEIVNIMSKFQLWLHGGRPITEFNEIMEYERGVYEQDFAKIG